MIFLNDVLKARWLLSYCVCSTRKRPAPLFTLHHDHELLQGSNLAQAGPLCTNDP